MKRFYYAIGSIIFVLLLLSFNQSDPDTEEEEIEFFVPKNWPDPVYDFSKNPLTKSGIYLGRKLFYDEKLSRDSTISCASCHLSYTGFTHIDHRLSHGIEGKIGTRNTQTIVNPAWQKNFMWDGGVNHLDMQPLAPFQGETEMGNSLENIISYLKTSAEYNQLFRKVFKSKDPITIPNVQKALSQFMLQFNSYNSKYDKVMREDPGVTFTRRERRGLKLFRKECASCHKEPFFTDFSFKNNGLKMDTTLKDYGRYTITGQSEDSLLFRVPSLRNIEFTFPYMHDGRYYNITTVMYHYSFLVEQTQVPTLSKELKGNLNLSKKQVIDLIAFLRTLTDKSFLNNKDLAYPN